MAKMSALSCFIFLSKKLELVDFEDGKESFTTCGTAVLAKGNTHSMATCDHEEADTRMLVHMLDAVANDAITGLVRTVDTDVIVIFVGMLNHLLLVNPACRYMGSIWDWKELPLHTHQWYMQHSWKGEVNGTSFLSFLHWL